MSPSDKKIPLITTGSIRHVHHYHNLFLSTLDITVKTGVSNYAPTWDIVMGVKSGTITPQEYEKEYLALLDQRIQEMGMNQWLEPLESRLETLTPEICNTLQGEDIEPCRQWSNDVFENPERYSHVVLLCYCDEGLFCHRNILANYIKAIYTNVSIL